MYTNLLKKMLVSLLLSGFAPSFASNLNEENKSLPENTAQTQDLFSIMIDNEYADRKQLKIAFQNEYTKMLNFLSPENNTDTSADQKGVAGAQETARLIVSGRYMPLLKLPNLVTNDEIKLITSWIIALNDLNENNVHYAPHYI